MGSAPNIYDMWQDGLDAMYGLNRAIDGGEFDGGFLELIRIRSSIVNRCGFCVSLHRKAARGHGVDSEKVRALREWRDSLLFSERERAALAFTDAMVTPNEGVPDDLAEALRTHFSALEITQLAYAVAAINAWNRVSIASDALGAVNE